MKKISTFIIDSDNNSRELIRNFTNELEYIQISDCYNSLKEAFNAIIKEQPQLIL